MHAPADVELSADPTPEWLAVYLSGLTPNRREVAPAILAGLPARRCYFACRRAGAVVASGLSVGDGRLASVQCMATLASARRQGCARAVLSAIEAWAAAQGCTHLYLQAETANAGSDRALRGLWLSRCRQVPSAHQALKCEEPPWPSANQPNLLEVDWSKIPAPEDDGAARHLAGHGRAGRGAAGHRRHAGVAGQARRPRRGVRLSAHRRARARSRWSTTGT